jgi:thiamine pyrophosphate-dependent acetolactate synthase large subunit-like protein
MMGGLNEFNTAIRAGIDLIVIVCNDAAYGAEHIQLKRKNLDPATTEFNWPSFAQTATALGGEGVLATSLAQLDLALDKLEARKGPFLIELSLDPNSVPPMRI